VGAGDGTARSSGLLHGSYSTPLLLLLWKRSERVIGGSELLQLASGSKGLSQTPFVQYAVINLPSISP